MIDRSLVVLTSIYLYISIYQQDQLLVIPYIVWTIVQVPINLLCCMYLTKVIEMWVILPWSITFMEFYGGLLAASVRNDWKWDETHRLNTLKIYNALLKTYSTQKPSMGKDDKFHETHEQQNSIEFQQLSIEVEGEENQLSKTIHEVQSKRELLKQKWDEIRREEMIRQMEETKRQTLEKKEAKKHKKVKESEIMKPGNISTTPIQNEKSRINEHEQMSTRLELGLNKVAKKIGGFKKSKKETPEDSILTKKHQEKDVNELEEEIKVTGSTKLVYDRNTEEDSLSTTEILLGSQMNAEKEKEIKEQSGMKKEENLSTRREINKELSLNTKSKSELTRKCNIEPEEASSIQRVHPTIEKRNEGPLKNKEGSKPRLNCPLWRKLNTDEFPLKEWSNEIVTEVEYQIDSSNDMYECKSITESQKVISKDISGEGEEKYSFLRTKHETNKIKMKKTKIGSKKFN
ncbi:uncharacterized protein [Lepeophtheirus salmonis]|nr:triadin-like isoform X2 [Lepeophtheirus salmonis]